MSVQQSSKKLKMHHNDATFCSRHSEPSNSGNKELQKPVYTLQDTLATKKSAQHYLNGSPPQVMFPQHSLTLYQHLSANSAPDCNATDSDFKTGILHKYTSKFSEQMHTCKACSYTTRSKNRTKNHIVKVHKDLELQVKSEIKVFLSCVLCKKTFVCREVLYLHLISQHVACNKESNHIKSTQLNSTNIILLAELNKECKVAIVVNKDGDRLGKLVATFSCTRCKSTFLSQNNLKIHLLSHWPQKSGANFEIKYESHLYWMCNVCNLSKLNSHVLFREHFDKVHYVNVGLEINECEKRASTGVKKKYRYLCPICKASCEGYLDCKFHVLSVHNFLYEDIPRKFYSFVCLTCNKNCNESSNIDFCCTCIHREPTETNPYNKSQNSVFEKPTSSSEVKKQKCLSPKTNKEIRFECGYCKEHFLIVEEYEVHMKTTHTNEPKMQANKINLVTCSTCKVVLSSEDKIKLHMDSCNSKYLRETNNNPNIALKRVKVDNVQTTKIVVFRFKCFHCNKLFWNENNCKNHSSEVHPNVEYKRTTGNFRMYYCKECCVILRTSNEFKTHRATRLHIAKVKEGTKKVQNVKEEHKKLYSLISNKLMVLEDGLVVLNKSLFNAEIQNGNDTLERQECIADRHNKGSSASTNSTATREEHETNSKVTESLKANYPVVTLNTSNQKSICDSKYDNLKTAAMNNNSGYSVKLICQTTTNIPENNALLSYGGSANESVCGEGSHDMSRSIVQSNSLSHKATSALVNQPIEGNKSDSKVQENCSIIHISSQQGEASKIVEIMESEPSNELECKKCSIVLLTSFACQLHMSKVHINEMILSYMIETTFTAFEKTQPVYLNPLHTRRIITENERLILSKFDRFEVVLYICCYCSAEFGTKVSFIAHLSQVHSQGQTVRFKYIQQFKSLYRCKECVFASEELAQCMEHNSSCTPQKPPSDAIVFDSFLFKYLCTEDCEVKIRDHNKNPWCNKVCCEKYFRILTLYKCCKCSSVFNLHYLLKNHMKICNQHVKIGSDLVSQQDMLMQYMKCSTIFKPVHLNDCRISSSVQVLSSEDKINNEKNSNISDYEIKILLAFPCPICPQIFLLGEKLMDHMAKCHSGHEHALVLKKKCQAYICNLCGIVKFSSQECEDHSKICAKGYKKTTSIFYCSSCKITFSSLEMYTEHVHNKHCKQVFSIPVDCEESYGCFQCPQIFSTLIMMEAHIKKCDKQSELCEEISENVSISNTDTASEVEEDTIVIKSSQDNNVTKSVPKKIKAMVNKKTANKCKKSTSKNKQNMSHTGQKPHKNPSLLCTQCNAVFTSEILLVIHVKFCNQLLSQESSPHHTSIQHVNTMENYQQGVPEIFKTHQSPPARNSLDYLQGIVLKLGDQNFSNSPLPISSKRALENSSDDTPQVSSVTSRVENETSFAMNKINNENKINDRLPMSQIPDTDDIAVKHPHANVKPTKVKNQQCKNCDSFHFPDSLNPILEFSFTFKSSYSKIQRERYECIKCHKTYFTTTMYMKHLKMVHDLHELPRNLQSKTCEVFKCLACVPILRYFHCFGALADHFQSEHNFEEQNLIPTDTGVTSCLYNDPFHHEIEIKEEEVMEIDSNNEYTDSIEPATTLEPQNLLATSDQYVWNLKHVSHYEASTSKCFMLPSHVGYIQGQPATSLTTNAMNTDIDSINIKSEIIDPLETVNSMQTVEPTEGQYEVKTDIKDEKLEMRPVVVLHRLKDIHSGSI